MGGGEDYGWDYPPGVTESDIDDEGWEEEEREEEPDEDALIEYRYGPQDDDPNREGA